MAQLKLTGFGKEYTEKKYLHRGRVKVSFEKAANAFVNGLLLGVTEMGPISTDSVCSNLNDGTVFNSIELRLVSYLPTPSEATPGLYNVKEIDRSAMGNFKVRITRSDDKLLIETTGFDGHIIANSDFSEKLKAYLGVK